VTLARAQRAIVVDASTAIPFLEGETGWLNRLQGWVEAGEMLLAPPHFPVEVANGLLRGSSVVSPDQVSMLIRELSATGFEVADRGPLGLERSIDLAVRHRLTVYDAAYLDLAIDVDGELATLDDALRSAADAERVPLVSPGQRF
jgi:predicted nucleic acid-binding protein